MNFLWVAYLKYPTNPIEGVGIISPEGIKAVNIRFKVMPTLRP